ncbi:MAG: hypothetical protein QM736_16535 [Vicinamibacterales bacterium]
MSAGEIGQRIKAFRQDLRTLSPEEVVKRHLTFGQCFALGDPQYFDLKKAVADHFGVHHSAVLLVGSGKLGFSVVPHKRYHHFHDRSDLDLAVVSADLFDQIWLDAYRFSQTKALWADADEFKDYLFRGWIRPDKLPPADAFERRANWWEFFRKLTSSGQFGRYRIAAGLYRSWQFLEDYQQVCIRACRERETGI